MTTPPLSPAAKAVLDAWNGIPMNTRQWPDATRIRLAAALRAAVDKVFPLFREPDETEWEYYTDYLACRVAYDCHNEYRAKLLAIANEMDPQP
jgi:hypothetical protein